MLKRVLKHNQNNWGKHLKSHSNVRNLSGFNAAFSAELSQIRFDLLTKSYLD